jgi:NAD(P)-dependent dehydrogenase (short-subunit alcohol dehydrogenase family)
MRSVLITGAAQGLGFATARLLLEQGWRVILVDVQSLEAPLAQLSGLGEAVARCGDIASESFVRDLASFTLGGYGALDGLVNNAGVSLIEPMQSTSIEQWQRVIGVNLTGPFLTCREFGAQMLARGRGSIVNVASIAGLAGVTHRAAYNASKHGLIGLTRTLAGEWGGRGVRVNAVCPGWIKTEMDEADQGSGAYSDQDIIHRVPQGRFARPLDVAEAIAMLLDEQRSAFINGVSLPVDGGWLADASWESLRLAARSGP